MNITNGIDYKYIECNLRQIANKFQTKVAHEPSPFKGYNFMTGEIVTRRKLLNGVWFELSYGTGFSQDYIFGVTFAKDNMGDMHDLSECCYEFNEVEELLKKASQL